jgi:hypothetical protein
MTATELDDKALRKAWLKQKFASWAYHEEMLRMHHGVIEVTLRALRRAEADTQTPASPGSGFKNTSQEAQHFKERYLPLMLRNEDLGKYKPQEWDKCRGTATFRSIPDYNRYLFDGIDAFAWMTHEELVEQGKYWQPMTQMAENIRRTVDDTWFSKLLNTDDGLLSDEITGPISYPPDWRQQLLGASASLVGQDAPRVRAGDPVPQAGLWRALDPNADEVRVSVGDSLPNFGSAYGITIWQRVGD